MIPEAQRIAIAEFVGKCWVPAWRFNGIGHYCEKCGRLDYAEIGRNLHEPERDPLNDLNAIHDAEKLHPMSDCDRIFALAKIVGADMSERSFVDIAKIASATAAQRAEAFLRTIGKWEET